MRLTIALLMIAAFSQPLSASAPMELKGIRLGMSEPAVKFLFPSADCSEREGSRDCFVSNVSFASVQVATLFVHFEGGVAGSVHIGIDESNFSLVVEALKVKFGAPGSDELGELQNRMGARFENRKVRWMAGDALLEAEQRGSDVDRSSITLSSKAAAEEFARKLKDKAAAAAKDL